MCVCDCICMYACVSPRAAMVMLYRASSLPMMAVLRSSCLSLSCNVLAFHVHNIFIVSFRPQYWMTSPPRFADKSDWGQLF